MTGTIVDSGGDCLFGLAFIAIGDGMMWVGRFGGGCSCWNLGKNRFPDTNTASWAKPAWLYRLWLGE